MEYTEEQTFIRLRRIPFRDACREYSRLYSKYGSICSSKFIEDLKKVGWTVSELYDEGNRLAVPVPRI